MDPLEHASIPTLLYLALSPVSDFTGIAFLVAGAVFPDLDALSKEHRSYFHSLLSFLPAFLAGWHFGGYFYLFALGWLSHLFLDLFTGVLPFFYPIFRKGYGISVRAVLGLHIPRFHLRIISAYPTPRRDYELDIGGGLALSLLTLFVLLLRLH
ncbi:metal-dependent hydrolase [Thermococcus stetteri]|uniref:metal-dependent hydrolase n=1 Tax=Thermococcus stetteri TaxID=49900 RepID=UPI001FD75719|nr:metal-dependent hydrolase [Thermococcus stetteri]MBP1911212.1 hypothetical protein [Thermococcus stetteri]